MDKNCYICPRCGYDTVYKLAMKEHLTQGNLCSPLLSQSLEDLAGYKNMIFQIKTVQSCCELCDSEYTSRYGWSKHMNLCTKYKKINTQNINRKNSDF
jgi:hypothetical protein